MPTSPTGSSLQAVHPGSIHVASPPPMREQGTHPTAVCQLYDAQRRSLQGSEPGGLQLGQIVHHQAVHTMPRKQADGALIQVPTGDQLVQQELQQVRRLNSRQGLPAQLVWIGT